MVFDKLKKLVGGNSSEGSDYFEVDVGQEEKRMKVGVRPFVLRKFEDVNEILNALREGYTIAIIDIQALRKKDIIELKRAVSKIKKTTEALEGNITGFGENIIIATPSFAEITIPENPVPAMDESRRTEMY
ncbi:cell division protein SepF [Candidatus Pacearchaeota archaeon]|nr:cell division protein SepF [Candidatus Pacearchaeota archaeon]